MTSAQDAYNQRRRVERNRPKPAKTQPVPQAIRDAIHSQRCRLCGARPVELHHIVPRSAFSKHDPDIHHPANCMPLCHTCHQHHHTRGADGRIPYAALLPAEQAFLAAHRHQSWIAAWYPGPQPIP